MKANDVVDLVYVTPHNFLYAYGVPRQLASDLIDRWYEARELVKKGGPEAAEPALWLRASTIVGSYRAEDYPDRTYANYAIGSEHILGMYIKERDPENVQERYAQAMEKLARAAAKESRHGDEWKGEDEP